MPTNKKPIITTDKNKVQAYNDSLFIKKNFNIFPHPKGYGEALKRVGQNPSADYFPAPEQPYILKKEKKKKEIKKKDIIPVPVKESIPKDTIPVDKPVIEPQIKKEPEPTVPKKLPGGSGPFARYPNMKKQLNNVKTSRMVNAKKVENIVPTFVSGAKSVKQYRGDENLPEAKNGMKKCGCKHVRSKYKYGTGAVVIPEGSAIVTAKNGAGRKAVEAHLRGDDEEVENHIRRMPEDKPTGRYKYKNDDGNKKLKSSSALGYVPAGQHKEKYYGKVADADFDKLRENNPWYDWANFDPSRKGDVEKFQSAFNKLSESLGSKAKLEVDDKLGEQTATAKVDYMGTVPENKGTEEDKTKTITDDKKKPEFKMKKGFDIPSLAEASAKAAVLGQGVEGVPENYLKLGRYNYASQLDRTLRENAIAANTAKENIRDVSGGSAGSYLANVANITAKRFEANAAAGTAEGIAKNELLNKNVDLGNTEATVNTGLKNQFAQQRSANRGAYNNMLVSLGQSIDTAADASKLMSNQRGADNQRLAILKSMSDSGNYDITTNPDGTMGFSVKKVAKGAKRLKTYKRR